MSQRQPQRHVCAPSRLLIGLGSPQRPRPRALAAVCDYVERLDAAMRPVPADRRLLAAFGPQAHGIARERFAGALPGMITAEYAKVARERIGPDRTLAVAQAVVLDDDAGAARATARKPLTFLSTLPPYVKSFVRQGFTEDDVTTLSDQLVDGLVAWGTPDDVAERAHGILAAGADHVILSVLGDGDQPTGVAAARAGVGARLTRARTRGPEPARHLLDRRPRRPARHRRRRS